MTMPRADKDGFRPTIAPALVRLLLAGALVVGPSPAAPARGGTVGGPSAAAIWQEEQQVVGWTNYVRYCCGLAPLEVDLRLTVAAQVQADNMARLDLMAHTLPGVPLPTLASRIQCVGYRCTWVGENLAVGAEDPLSVVAMWINSPTHLQNLLCPGATQVGVGIAHSSQGDPFFCLVMGRPG
jgi:uncharacterized protein YkwD